MNIPLKNLPRKFAILLVGLTLAILPNLSLNSGSQAAFEYKEAVVDDPKQRRPDITLAKSWLNWAPHVSTLLDFSVTDLSICFRSPFTKVSIKPLNTSEMNSMSNIIVNVIFTFPMNG